MALGHLFDGKVTSVFGSHTHIPTADQMILSKGTSYQTDLGMCGDYDSVIGLNKNIFLKKKLNEKGSFRNTPSMDKASICGSIINADKKTGLTKRVNQLIIGGKLKNF